MKRMIILLCIVCIIMSACVMVKKRFNASVDKPSGTVEIEGIKEKVIIRRDSLGIPYIEANNEEDLFFGAGYAMASDRLWQMYLRSMAMQGRLSEIAGKDMLQTDIYFRTLGIKKYVDDTLLALDKRYLLSLESFSKGVNTYLKTKKYLPAEFAITGFAPHPWTPSDSLYCFSAIGYGLSYNLYEELDYMAIASQLGYEKTAWLFPVYPGTPLPEDEIKKLDSVPFHDLTGDMNDKHSSTNYLDNIIPKSLPASNNWALMGSKTLGGKSIICNDTHLIPTTPSNWMIMHLKCPGYEAGGVLIPGLPVVVLGYNGHVAWGVTMVCADTEDLFIEKLKTDKNKLMYLYKGEWLPAETRNEVFRIKSEKPEMKVISATCHGPLLNTNISTLPFSPVIMPDAKNYGLALSWMFQGISDTYAGFYKLAQAKNIYDANKAILNIKAMYLNFIYADSDNIAWQVSGLCPLRKNGRGLFPSSGWDGEYDWTGVVPVEKMPHDMNPSKGFLATANNMTVPQDYPVMISNSWAKPERFERIETMLAPMNNVTTGDMISMQVDRYSIMASKVQKMLFEGDSASEIRNAIDRLSPKNQEKARKALELLDPKVFNCVMSPTSIFAAVMGAFYHTATINTFMDDFGPSEDAQWKAFGNLTGKLKNANTFLNETKPYGDTGWKSFESSNNMGYSAPEDHILSRKESPFWDDIRTGKKETKADILAISLADAVLLCEKNMGPDPRDWQWGKLIHYEFKHDITNSLPFGAFDDYFNPGTYPAGGDWATINVAGFSWTDDSFEVIETPVMRMIVNFGDSDPSAYIVTVPGQSGNPSSPHYKDMTAEYFITGKIYPMPFSDENIKSQYTDVLTLIPK
ncbi:MAG TPA: penicillin acylase family protein [Desulfomonilia bacterium]